MDGIMLWMIGVLVTWMVLMTVIFCIQAWVHEKPKKAPDLDDVLPGRVSVRRFFASEPAQAGETRAVDEGTVRCVQRYLMTEQDLVEQFVSQPSVETLYLESDRRISLN